MMGDEIYTLWDRLDGAINKIVTALPYQMSEAATKLEAARKAYRAGLYATGAQKVIQPAQDGDGKL